MATEHRSLRNEIRTLRREFSEARFAARQRVIVLIQVVMAAEVIGLFVVIAARH
jgi:hypothetical protein